MAIITPALITSLRTGFSSSFQDALTAAPTDWAKVATRVPSSSASNTYGWLGQFPALREWVGDRVIKDMAAQAYQVLNKLYEGTVSVKRSDIEDDNVGIYTPLFAEMGRAAATHPDQLVFDLLKNAGAINCYDGQFFFDTDHPVYPNVDGTGTAVPVSNVQSGVGEAWYLLDTSRALKPFIYQERTTPELEAMTATNDEGVFVSDSYRYGIRYRCNSGLEALHLPGAHYPRAGGHDRHQRRGGVRLRQLSLRHPLPLQRGPGLLADGVPEPGRA